MAKKKLRKPPRLPQIEQRAKLQRQFGWTLSLILLAAAIIGAACKAFGHS